MAKRGIIVILYVAGTALIGLALLFFIAASANPSRFWVAIVSSAAGIGAFVVASAMKRSADQSTPTLIDADVVRLAAKFDGKLTPDMLVSNLYVDRTQALESLARLQAKGSCRIEASNSGPYYVFENVKPKRMIRKCIYCGREQPLSQPIIKCPYCGGEVRVVPKDS